MSMGAARRASHKRPFLNADTASLLAAGVVSEAQAT